MKRLIIILPITLLLLFGILLVISDSPQVQDTESIFVDDVSLEELRKEADQGDVGAQLNLGGMYAVGEGVVPQDYEEAIKYWTMAANQENADAQFCLGLMYAKGQGVVQDYEKAVQMYTKAAEQGQLDAQLNLGVMYDNGHGVAHDYKKAIKWYTEAATQGYYKAQYNLGLMYYTSQEYDKAFNWFTKAAEQEDTDAQYALGVMSENGEGVVQDFIQAYKWYDHASTHGNNEAKQAMYILNSKMSPAQIAEAQRLSREFQQAEQQTIVHTPAQSEDSNRILHTNDTLGFSIEIPENWHDSKAAMAHAFAPKSVILKKVVDHGVIEGFSVEHSGKHQRLVVTMAGRQKQPIIQTCESYIRGAQVYDKTYKASPPKEVDLPNVNNKCAYFTEEVDMNASMQNGLQILVPHENGYFLMLQFRADPQSFDINWNLWWEIAYSLCF